MISKAPQSNATTRLYLPAFALLTFAALHTDLRAEETKPADGSPPAAAQTEPVLPPETPAPEPKTAQPAPAQPESKQPAAPVAKPAESASPLAAGLSPYRLRVWVAFEKDPSFHAAFQEGVRNRVIVRLARIFGAACELEGNEVAAPDWFAPQTPSGLARLSEEDVRRQIEDKGIDKGLIAVISRDGSRYRLVCREWDAARRRLSEPAAREIWDRDQIADATADLLRRTFQPTCIVENVDATAKTAILTLRAGSLPLGNSEQKLLVPGDVLVGFMRYFDQKQELKSIQQIPWTYLIVDSIEGSTARCTVVSGVRAPLGTNRRRRVESFAIRVRPVHPESRLRLTLFAKEVKPLPGYKVSITPRTPVGEKAVATPLERIITDRDGWFSLKPNAESPVVWVTVRNGDAMLARVPCMPGVERSAELQLPDDALRIGVERELDLLKARLVETVAQRATINARALSAAKLGQADEARKILAEGDKLTKLPEFETQLNAIRVPAVETSQKLKDRLTEARIKRLATLTSDLVRTYLAEDKFKVAREEIEQLIEVVKTNQKAPGNPQAAPEPKAAAEPKVASEPKAAPEAKPAPEPKAEPAPTRKQPF